MRYTRLIIQLNNCNLNSQFYKSSAMNIHKFDHFKETTRVSDLISSKGKRQGTLYRRRKQEINLFPIFIKGPMIEVLCTTMATVKV